MKNNTPLTKFEEYLAQREDVFQKKMENLERNLAENNVTVMEQGQWTINDGLELTFDQAFGGPSKIETQARKHATI